MSGIRPVEGRWSVHAPTRRLTGWSSADLRRWPGRTAAALHVGPAAVAGPNGDAGTTPGPIRSEHWEELTAYLTLNRSWIDGVVVDGPDPTADPDLTSLLAALAEARVPTRLVTSGMHPSVIRHALAEKLVSSISLTVSAMPERLAERTGIADAAERLTASIAAVIGGRIDHDFHTRVGPDTVDLIEVPLLAAALRGGRLYVLEPATAPSDIKAADRAELRAAARSCCACLPTIVRDAR